MILLQKLLACRIDATGMHCKKEEEEERPREKCGACNDSYPAG